MIIISHRGNINGPIPDKENRPSYIDCAIGLGYDVEVDLRLINGEFWLGHDEPQFKINNEWMELRKNKIWYHCKNIESAIELSKKETNFKFFCHASDDYVITSGGKLWVHDLSKNIDGNCIIPLLNSLDIDNYQNSLPYGICTDFVTKASIKYKNL